MRSIPLAACALALGAAATARSQTLAQFPLPDHYYSFDRCLSSGGTRAMDDARIWNPAGPENAYHLTLRNGATCSAGLFGSGGRFDGIDDVADMAVDVDATTALTVSAWVLPRNTGRWQTIVNKWYTPDAWGLFIEPGYFNFTLALPSGNRTIRQPATANVWTHVAVVYSGSLNQVRMYINGVSTAPMTVPAGPINNSNRPIAVGGHPSWNAFDGSIDEVKIWNRALNATQMAQVATTPSGVADRGVHLYSSQWAANPGDAAYGWHVRDLSLLQTIGNLNSVKSTIFSYREFGGTDYTNLHQVQRNKLTQLKAAAGNHATWVFRAWPNPGDFVQAPAYFDKGFLFAQNLASVFYHLQTSLQLQNVVIEVANEPNISSEGFADPSGWPNLSYYNDFFRGFYWGMRAVGYQFPLAYAGLSPGDFINEPNFKRFNSTVWYQDVNTQNHIRDYAAKVGVHVYWASGARLATNEGKYYREIKNILAGAGVPRRGLIATEFNGVRSTFGNNPAAQITDACQWWREFQSDAASYWTEQATIYISHADDANDRAQYELADTQLDPIRNCR
ncbi:MAG: LamG domain-containing protein [Vicinamibacteria bacterium]